ncbi:glycosyltransferase [Breznakia sp. PFB1-12]|uniref:glycosyltransferase family 2 protein n=2 Tax=unclassified Breznakia TaxID=2623764 RepID=UPI00247BE115|nr:GT2 family glycosyltransferase [Breznakia sp. PH1-1]MDH6404997.1 GT2 family glycosyltransferase [Breznakia sp. PF1-11]MDH6412692.1 GT2 family glycosyltransferase [Breznakia sp. PFB1-11]MDH6415072.1 GT2 family glycosyltransferase [Breznakia sp. PFB1-14]MDH6417383.1 GT2 family glycosyltransferase [Breznakia sp. PFB1-4]MDH6419745.1 GT2 family glycosyltransferase [Breznakia sp. PFB1-12]MDH6474757.1 GT2 family glycosyltransferase [Breznakia sp. PFB2-30]MDH6477102.1 GT2 family glycosyltransfera
MENYEKNMYSFGFVILHYQVEKVTMNCVESIVNRVDTENYQIVIVDNASPNKSGNTLKKYYANNKNIHVLILEEGLGFSGGNNKGFMYAKNELHCDFIVMLNNDTLIIQDDFIKQIVDEYEQSHFAVLGPEIHLPNGKVDVYPFQILKLDELDKDRERIYALLKKNKSGRENIELLTKRSIMKLIMWDKWRHKLREEKTVPKRQEMVRLHGCCLIFSPVYVKAFDGLDNRTMFYGEEDILFVRMIRNHMLSVYQPKVKIMHMEQVSTGSKMKTAAKKRRYVYETHLETLDMLEELYHEDLDSLKGYI